jgi:hypothetical protein
MFMSVAEQPDAPRFVLLEPEEALARARPFPSKEELHLADVTDAEWDALFDAIEHR